MSSPAKVTKFSAQEWLATHQVSGVQPSMPELLAYRARPLPLPMPKRQGTVQQSGNKLSRFRGRGMEFDEVRHYQAGDDIRAIDWRVTARTGKTHTKLFREETERPVFVCVDYSQSMLFGSELLYKSVQAAHVAAGICWHAIQRGDRIGGLIFNAASHVEVRPQSRQHGALMLLKQLIAMHPERPQTYAKYAPVQPLSKQIQRLHSLCRPGADVVLISDFSDLNDDTLSLLRGLRRHHAVTAILVDDPLELALPPALTADIQFFDGERQRQALLNDEGYRKEWQQRAQFWRAQRLQLLQQAGIPTHTISSALPAAQQWHEVRS
ncbi:DUF58 domain-containing protein [Aliidiomarina halalkaliphila]|uniref:DUF58 domain-containing protein n=1 Tax=Aliidiomarina halalkaliphila TaxID=2593535 RepID=A0A552X2V7_9GAMM|nr:DUF58 domain-containing protein [Aliidiomarina halalkaliphila]TRW49370.1 DUF58 domain-containing protein [Aliidiomarina halalkaliphila]